MAAVADAHRRERREIGSDPEIWHATVSLSVDYPRPTPVDSRVPTQEASGKSYTP